MKEFNILPVMDTEVEIDLWFDYDRLRDEEEDQSDVPESHR